MKFKVGDKVIVSWEKAKDWQHAGGVMPRFDGKTLLIGEINEFYQCYFMHTIDGQRVSYWPEVALTLANKPLETVEDLEALYAEV